MPISYRFLRPENFPEVHHTFVGAFADYAVDMSYLSEGRLLNRAIKNGVDFESSVGAYDGGEMVGFTLVGLDHRRCIFSAFDIATGVVPSHQGRGIARQMLSQVLPHLQGAGVERFILEVIQENEPAIRAYQATGFEILRELDCYELSLDEEARAATGRRLAGGGIASTVTARGSLISYPPASPLPEVPMRAKICEVSRDLLPQLEEALDWQPSWENSISSILRIPDEVVVRAASAREGAPDRLAGAGVYYPALNWILCLVVRPSCRRQGLGTVLMRDLIEHISVDVPSVRILNIDRRDDGMNAFLAGIGFKVYVSQYEMELVL